MCFRNKRYHELTCALVLFLVAICTRSEMEDFLREAACMKEFDHANVMRLLGKSSQPH